MNRYPCWIVILALSALALGQASAIAAELVKLTPENWDEYIPQGKEVDCIYGDFVLRNDRITAVIAQPIAGRHANMTVQDVRGAIIDLTLRDRPNDQLSAFYPGAARHPLDWRSARTEAQGAGEVKQYTTSLKGMNVKVELGAAASENQPAVTVEYELSDGSPAIIVATTYENPSDRPLEVELVDSLRADRSFTLNADRERNVWWAYDEAWGQAYGVIAEGHVVGANVAGGRPMLHYEKDGSFRTLLAPKQKYTLVRKVFPAANVLDVLAVADEISGRPLHDVSLEARDSAGPIADAVVTIEQEGNRHGWGRTGENGVLATRLPPGDYEASVEAIGRAKQTISFEVSGPVRRAIELERPGYVSAEIRDGGGESIPCKVAFYGMEGTPDPNWGPDTFEYGVQNLQYTPSGKFHAEIAPGKYRVAISYGPEYDAFFTQIEVLRGQETSITAALKRVVDSRGWVSSDFHSHSSPSGDNTSSQLGRVLNLLCEHIEFAPCTEHNRISTYEPHLTKLGAEKLMATCSGMELTGSPLPVNHQNAFPLQFKPRTQDGGAPRTDADPVVQIERLALWDDNSDKLVQGNHPNLFQVLGDRDLDGKPDGGFEKMIGFMDVVEVHPPEWIFLPPKIPATDRERTNTVFHWLQMLNLGYHVPGVVNTDAHYNHHGSGWVRNYLESATDDPAKIDTMEMVHAAEHGHVLMTTGPFMEVKFAAAKIGRHSEGTMGDDVAAPGGEGNLYVRVQCPNWMDVNRVQVFVNGKPDAKLNFTRKDDSEGYSDGVVKFERQIPIALPSDAHLVVAAIGEGLDLTAVQGPKYGKHPPMALANPIFVDVDGEGFQHNNDDLGFPLPLAKDFKPSHPHRHRHD
jgi:hypothetical protein